MATAKPKPESKEKALARVDFTEETLRGLSSVDDVMKLMVEAYGSVINIEDLELGDGFRTVKGDDKNRLVDESLLVLDSSFHDGDFTEFVSLMVYVPRTKEKLRLNMGGDVPDVIREIIKQTGRPGGWGIPQGLRKSEYDICAAKGCGLPRKPSETVCENCGDTSEKRAKGTSYYIAY